jgi:hypothetical protein
MASSRKKYLPHNLERHFPYLTRNVYEVKSRPTPRYNCIAFAAGDRTRWWEPDIYGIYYWPPHAKREYTLVGYIQAFEAVGYEQCKDDNYQYERGFEKVAIYYTLIGNPHIPPGSPTHAALQLDNGIWMSKLGPWHDIQHLNLDCLNGDDRTGITRPYGQPVQVLKGQFSEWVKPVKIATI